MELRYYLSTLGRTSRARRILHQLFSVTVGVWLAAGSVQAATPGSVLVWGDNFWGQTTVPLEAQSGVTAIAAGLSHVLALRSSGGVVEWGYDADGRMDVPFEAQSGVIA